MQSSVLDVKDILTKIYFEPYERQDAFNTLKALNTTESTLAFQRLAQDFRVPPYYPEILHELNKRGVLDAMPYFEEILLIPSDDTNELKNQLTVVINLGDYPHHKDTIRLLIHVIKHYHIRSFIQYSVYALGKIGTDEAVYALFQLIQNHASYQVRHLAISSLRLTNNPSAVAVLLNTLDPHLGYLSEGQPDTNVMGSLLHLWQEEVKPFDIMRWLKLLEYWLHVESTSVQAAYSLQQLPYAEAKAILEQWSNHQVGWPESDIFY